MKYRLCDTVKKLRPNPELQSRLCAQTENCSRERREESEQGTMADVEKNGIHVNDWMNEQPVSCFEWFEECCSSKRVRMKYARRALFMRFTVEELDRRHQKYMSFLRPEENQAVRQVIDKFEKGWYTAIIASEWIGTFYSPLSPLFTLLFLSLREFLSMPFTCCFCKGLCRKGIPSIWTICLLPIFPLFFVIELVILIIRMVGMLVVSLLVTPLELIVFLCGMCYYRFGRLRKCGVFVYGCKLKFIIVRNNRSLLVTNGAKLALHHASFCQLTFCNPITAIFKNINTNLKEYSYGDIQGVHLSAREVEMYGLYQQENVALWLQAEGLA